jgi:hypothetical protein
MAKESERRKERESVGRNSEAYCAGFHGALQGGGLRSANPPYGLRPDGVVS